MRKYSYFVLSFPSARFKPGFLFPLIIFLVSVVPALSQPREVTLLDKDWLFSNSDPAGAGEIHFNDRNWEKVVIPHDWAIKGAFNEMHDAQKVKVTEDGERKAALRTGRTGSLPWIGTGWYRRRITIPPSTKDKKYFIEFDGAMSHAVVYLNGKRVGTWPYGYSSFSFDITDYIKTGENILAVRLENLPESSRWYPGAGIYRHVRLVSTGPVHVSHWGTYITTPEITPEKADIQIRTQLQNHTDRERKVTLETTIIDKDGKHIAVQSTDVTVKKETVCKQNLAVGHPDLWGIETPHLYKALSKVITDGRVTDTYETVFGIRSFRFDNRQGFFLNGRHTKLKGVCLHHDLGALGAAINYRAIERQLELLKEMGCNAIRCSHNPPAPELLDLCDKMGLLVIDEAFDEWKYAKCKNGYNRLWDQWAEKDLVAMIRRDRNHPSVFMWSIGNEIKEQDKEGGEVYCRFLTDICHREDPTRPVTAGFNRWENAIERGFADIVDVPGWNYKPQHYKFIHEKHPHWKMYGSETASTVSSRGEYIFPAEVKVHTQHENNQCSSYDLEFPRWASLPDTEFAAQDSFPFIAGEFVWTGFDYLGEPTPYNYPSHSSYFGIFDLGGIAKDRYYLYKSKWSDEEVLHILPHWTWPDRTGMKTPVFVYTSFDSVELFVNGKSQGIKKKNKQSDSIDRYRLIWNDVVYQPGEIKAIAYDRKGKPVKETTTKTAGKPYRILLEPDRNVIRADGKDLSFVTVSITDKDRNVCPGASNHIRFDVKGNGFVRGVTNGDPTNTQSLAGKEMKAFHGQCTVIVQSTEEKGTIELRATSAGLETSIINLHAN